MSPEKLAPKSCIPFIDDRAVLDRHAKSMLDTYTAHVDIVQALGQAYGFKTVFFWQPSMFATGKKLTSEEQHIKKQNNRVLPGAQMAFEAVDEAIRNEGGLTEQTGVVDLRHALDQVERTTFVDSNHLTSIGNEAVANAMSPYFVNLLGTLPVRTPLSE